MPRSIWKGSIAFGLVSIPVELHTAVRDHRPKFRMLHARDKSPVRYERVCQREGKPVAWEDLVKGFEYEKGRFVMLTKGRPEDGRAQQRSRDRHPGLRQGRRDRRSLFRNAVLPDAPEGIESRIRAASRCAQGIRASRHRQDHHPRGAASCRGRGHRRCAGVDAA